ncbi:hypothetical protein TNCV_995921 [Trichonephila clavipes]|nr:hypothetical protein TNCV_995921 [Trichonephila clavipes]
MRKKPKTGEGRGNKRRQSQPGRDVGGAKHETGRNGQNDKRHGRERTEAGAAKEGNKESEQNKIKISAGLVSGGTCLLELARTRVMRSLKLQRSGSAFLRLSGIRVGREIGRNRLAATGTAGGKWRGTEGSQESSSVEGMQIVISWKGGKWACVITWLVSCAERKGERKKKKNPRT